MIVLNISNVEDLIFYDNKIKKILPEFSSSFAQWNFAKQNVGFRQLAKRTLADFLNSLQQEHLEILSKYFGQNITIDKLDYHIIKNATYNLEDIELFEGLDGYNFDVWRSKDKLHVTFWR